MQMFFFYIDYYQLKVFYDHFVRIQNNLVPTC